MAQLRGSFRSLLASLQPPRVWGLAALALAVATPLFFIFSTHLIWEDFFITLRYSENLARGRGLVYAPGEHVYGFTSPLNALIPALAGVFFKAGNFLPGLWLLRLVSIAGLALALAAISTAFMSEVASGRNARWAALVFAAAAALEIKTEAFATSGQEAGLVLGLLAPAFVLLVLDWRTHWGLVGVFWAGLMYSRPDAFIYVGALGIAALAFPNVRRRELLVPCLKSALVCAALYLPWFLFTWGYYGSPVPHTVTAKFGLTDASLPAFKWLQMVALSINRAPWAMCAALAPIYDRLDGGAGASQAWIHDLSFALQLVAVLYWAIPSRDRLGRMASLIALIFQTYLGYVTLVSQFCPWYYPPLAFMSLLAIVRAFATLGGAIRPRWLAGPLSLTGWAGTLVLVGFIFFTSLGPLRFKQDEVEWHHRREIGLWLKGRVKAGDSVYLESLGYIGYFSGAHMLDWPGLVSAEVTAARRQIGTMTFDNWALVAARLKPAWIVTRPNGWDMMKKNDFLLHHYRLEKVFDISAQLNALGAAAGAPGMNINYGDAAYGVFRRTD